MSQLTDTVVIVTGASQGIGAALAQGLAAFGLINAGAVARGAWFGPIDWRRMRPARLQRR